MGNSMREGSRKNRKKKKGSPFLFFSGMDKKNRLLGRSPRFSAMLTLAIKTDRNGCDIPQEYVLLLSTYPAPIL